MTPRGPDVEYLELARTDPKKAIDALDDLLLEWNGPAHTALRSTILRGAAIAMRFIGDIPGSDRYLRRAIDEAVTAGNHRCTVEAQITMSGNVMLQGDTTGALELLRSLDPRGDHSLEALIKVQEGMVLARTGQAQDALTKLTEAVEAADSVDDPFMTASAMKNRAMHLTQLGRYDEAENDLLGAHDRFEALGLDLETVFCRHNLGLLASYVGDLPVAFERFEAAEARMRALSDNDFESKAGHCRALVSAGLYREAAEMAAEAARRCFEQGYMADGAEALLMSAQAWLESGVSTTAHEQARQAAALFGDQGRSGWRAAALLIAATIEVRSGERLAESEIDAMIVALQDADLHRDALVAHLVWAEGRAAAGEVDRALDRLASLRPKLANESADLQLAAATSEARCYQLAGRIEEAEQVAQRGYSILADQQAVIVASDLRVGVRRHADRLGDIGLSAALGGGDPLEVLAWLERIRLASTTPRPVRPESSAKLRSALGRLRSLAPADESERAELEVAVRTIARSRSGRRRAPIEPISGDRLEEALADVIGVNYAVVDDGLIAVVVRDGTATVHQLGDVGEVDRLTRSLRSALRRRSTGLEGPRSAKRIDRTLDRLGDLLVGPLTAGGEPLLITATAELLAVPWAVLPGRPASTTCLATSLTAWAETPRARLGGDRVLVGGPDLDHADQEIDALRRVGAHATELTGDAASVEATLRAIDGASVAHIVAHGTVRTDNPLFSSLRMADGELSVYELGDLERAPSVVILSACHVGLPADAPGQELLGMVTGFLNAGTSCVIASTLPVPDDRSTIDIMTRLHRFLADGLGPAVAWAEVQRTCVDDDQLLDTACFTVFGRG